MANTIGTLLVELGINTLAFKGGLDKATYQARAAANEIKKSFSELGSSVTNLGRELGASFGPVGGAVDVLTSSFKTLAAATEGIGGGIAPAFMAIVGVAGGVAAAILAVAAADAMMASEGHEAVEALNLMSEKMGVSIGHLQNLKAAGESVNMPVERMQMGFRRLAGELADMGLKSTKATDLLQKLGVTSKDPYEAMLQIADGISKVQDKTTQLNDANTLFGARLGAQMLPLLKKGSEGFEEYGRVVDEFGQRVSGNAIEATDKWKKSTIELHTAWEGMKIEFADSTWVNALTEKLAKAVKIAGEIGSGDTRNNPFLLPVFNEKGNNPGSAPAAGAGMADKDESALEKAREAADKAAASARELYMHIKEGGPAGVALAEAMERIKRDTEDSANSDYKDAAAIQLKIPALQEAARLEKQRNELLLSLPKKTDMAVNEQSVGIMKAYANAIKDQGAASADAATAENIRLAVEKFSAPYIEANLENTAKFKEELQRFTKAATEAATAESAFGKAAEAAKMLDEYVKKTNESTKAKEAEALESTKIGQAQAAMSTQLDAATRAVKEQGDRLTELHKVYADDSEVIKQAQRLYGANVSVLDAATAALERNKKAVADKITAAELQKSQQEIDKTKEYTQLLKVMPEAYAKAESAARAKAAAAGLDADATAKEVAMAKQLVDLQMKQAAAQNANSTLSGPGQQAKQLQMNIDAINQASKAYLQEGGSVDVVNKALATEYAKLTAIQAQSGGFFSGAKAGFAQFAADTESAGTMMQKAVSTGLKGIEDNLAQMIVTGKASWASLVDDMEMQLVKFAESQIFTTIFKDLGSALSSSDNGFLSSIGGMFGGAKADGGDLTPGKNYLIGERGPEIFKAGSAGGTIIPNGQIGGGGGGSNITVVQNIQAPDVDSFKRSATQLHTMAYVQASAHAARMKA